MNKKIGFYSSVTNSVATAMFLLFLLLGNDYGGFMSSIFIAFSFIPMICANCFYSSGDGKVAGYTGAVFSGIYAVFILIVYYAQITSVIYHNYNEQAMQIIDYSKFGLFFNYDLLGYGIMGLSTFFSGLTINKETKNNIWLRRLMVFHGLFFISSFTIPLFGLFKPGASDNDWIGTSVLCFWCLYFIPIGILSAINFSRK